MFIISIFLAVLGGLTLAAQKIVNAALGVRIGSMSASFFNHAVGALCAFVLIAIGIRTGNFSLLGVPLHYFLGGCLGVFAIYLVNFAIPRIGAMAVSMCLIFCQLLSSCIIDHFGFLGAEEVRITATRGAGVLLILLGAVLVLVKRERPPAVEDAEMHLPNSSA